MVTPKKKNIRSAASVLLLIGFFYGSLSAQEVGADEPISYQNRFKFAFTAFSGNSLQLESRNNAYLNSKRALSGELGLAYDFYQSENFFITVGLGAGIVPYNFNFVIPADESAPTAQENNDLSYNSYFIFYSNVPITLNYAIPTKKKLNWCISAGIGYSRLYSGGYTEGVGMIVVDATTLEEYRIFEMEISDTISANHFNVLSGVSVVWETKDGCEWSIGAVAQIGTRPVGTGSFQFANVDHPSTGTLELGFSYVGLRTSYGLRTRGHRIKEKEKKARTELAR
jgi:hypothetical protein